MVEVIGWVVVAYRILVSALVPLGLIVKLRYRSQVRSKSGPEGPRTKVQRPGPGLYTKFGLSPPTHPLTSKLFSGSD